jgi:UDP-glucose:(heptosyl)LPS alpha-1,3-glucosyltransferase
MKIALNIEAIGARRGGAEKYAGTVARWLVSEGNEVHVFATEVDAGELPASTRVHHVQPMVLPGFGWLRAYLFARRSEQMLHKSHFDLIVGFNKVWYVDAYLAVGGAHAAALECNSRRFRSPIIRSLWWLSKVINPKQWVFRLIAARQFGGSHRPHIIAPAHLVAEHFRDYYGVEPGRISVVYNALDSLALATDETAARQQFRKQVSLAPDHLAVLFVARNYVLKGLEPLLEAFVPVVRQRPEMRLVVCGSRRDGRFRRYAARLGLANRVIFLGFVEDIRRCFAGSDVFAFPTFYDPCSLVVLEAMQAGLPVITTKQNGASELLTDGVHGFVLDSPWSIKELSDRMLRLGSDHQLRRSMGQAARRQVQAYTVEARRQEMLAALETAARCGAGRPGLPAAA